MADDYVSTIRRQVLENFYSTTYPPFVICNLMSPKANADYGFVDPSEQLCAYLHFSLCGENPNRGNLA